MSFYKIAFGKTGEDDATKFLKKSGYKIIERNYRTRYGEIDIIAKDKNVLIFIEVKNRKHLNYGLPEESVDLRKQKQISKTAVHYLWKNKISNMDCRFDVVSIIHLEENKKEIKLIKNAFSVATNF